MPACPEIILGTCTFSFVVEIEYDFLCKCKNTVFKGGIAIKLIAVFHWSHNLSDLSPPHLDFFFVLITQLVRHRIRYAVEKLTCALTVVSFISRQACLWQVSACPALCFTVE